jgi:uncharacterized membrane protein
VILSLFEWLQNTGPAEAIRNSVWAFAVVQSFHLLSLAVLAGAVLVVDLRMLGFGLSGQRIPDLIRYARPWLMVSVLVMIVTGFLMFIPAAASVYYYNNSFWVKMISLPVAALFSLGLREWLIRKPSIDTSVWTRLIGVASIMLWFTVTAAGRWIAYSG